MLSPANEQQNYRRVVTLYHDRYYREAEQLLDTLIKNVVLEKAKFVNDSQKVRLSKYYVLGATIARDKAAHPDFEENKTGGKLRRTGIQRVSRGLLRIENGCSSLF